MSSKAEKEARKEKKALKRVRDKAALEEERKAARKEGEDGEDQDESESSEEEVEDWKELVRETKRRKQAEKEEKERTIGGGGMDFTDL